jgi:outer membrane protein assembly factor BamB
MPGPGLSLEHPIVVTYPFETSTWAEIGRFPAVHGDVMFVGSRYAFSALDLSSGKTLWSIDMRESWRWAPVFSDGLVYTYGMQGNLYEYLYAIDAQSGRILWKFGPGLPQTPAVVDGTIFLADADHLVALDAVTGSKKWSLGTESVSISTPAVHEGIIAIATDSPSSSDRRSLVALDATTGEELWKVSVVAGYSQMTPAISEGTIYCNDAIAIHAFDLKTGEERWRHEFSTVPLSLDLWTDPAPSVDGGAVYAGNANSLLSLDAVSGETRWEFKAGDTIHTPTAVSDGVVYAGSKDTCLYAIDASSGQEIWRARLGGNVYSPGIIDGRLFVTTASYQGLDTISMIVNRITTYYFVEEATIYEQATTDSAVLLTVGGGSSIDRIGTMETYGDVTWTMVTLGDVEGWTPARFDFTTRPMRYEIIQTVYDPEYP